MIVDFISSSSLIIPLCTGFANYFDNSRYQGYFLGFIVFSLAFEIISLGLVFNGINNHWMFNIFLICDFIFFVWYFNKREPFGKWMFYLTSIIAAFIVFNTIKTLYFNISLYPESLFFMVLFLYFIIQSMYVQISLLDDADLLHNPIFWITIARIFYYLTIFSIYIYTHLSTNSFNNSLFAVAFKIINATGNIVCNFIFGYSFLCKRIHN